MKGLKKPETMFPTVATVNIKWSRLMWDQACLDNRWQWRCTDPRVSVRQVVASAGRKELHVMDDELQQVSCRHGLHNHTWSCCWEQPAEHSDSNPDPMREDVSHFLCLCWLTPAALRWFLAGDIQLHFPSSFLSSYLNLVIASNGKKLRK